ncbi:hypothetical protein [Amycolatopsis sp. CFH S0078]|uniref:hypothetical protein n=1 Tax=Amycolatopsis sp. CFH S0078 TaxID=1644108 RepID=UPI00106DFA25|nr:hypothetical protein [Amycolatopsis sp. CFH S0078]
MADASGIPPEVREYLESAPEAFLRCRLFHHNWDLTHELGTYFIEHEGQADETWRQELECARCGLPGVDYCEPWTCVRVGTRRILYPQVEGYLAEVPVAREHIRLFLAEKQMRHRKTPRSRNGRARNSLRPKPSRATAAAA